MAERTRSQSEVVGVLLLTGVMLVLTITVGVAIFANFDAQFSERPTVDMDVTATTDDVTIGHAGGDTIDVSELDVVLRNGGTERYGFDSFTQTVGSDAGFFAPGDRWSRGHNSTGDSMEVLLVHTPSNTILDRQDVELVPTGPLFEVSITETNSPVEQGNTLTVDAEVKNTGIASDTQDIEFEFDGSTEGTEAVTLDPGEDTALTFSYDTTSTGTGTHTARVSSANRSDQEEVRVVEDLAEIEITSVDGLENNTANHDYTASINITETAGVETDNLSVDLLVRDSDEQEAFDETKVAPNEVADDSVDVTFDVGSLSVDDYEYFVSAAANNAKTVGDRGIFSVVPDSAQPPSVTITSSSIESTGGSGKYDVSVTFEASDPNGDITNYTASLYNSSSETVPLDNVSSNIYDGATTTVSLTDDDTSNGESPLYVLVEVGDSTGRVGNDSVTLSADNEPPTASFTYTPSDPDPGEQITYDASGSSDPDGDSLTYEWDWTNDGTIDATGVTATHSYSSEGSYTVELTVSDGNGGVTSTTETVSVLSDNPAGFSSVSASNLPKGADSTTQTLSFTPNQTLSSGETVDIDLSDAQGVDKKKADLVDYQSASVDSGSSSGIASFSTQTETTAVVTYTATSDVSAGTSVTIEITGIRTGNPKGSQSSFGVPFTRSDGTTESTTFTVS